MKKAVGGIPTIIGIIILLLGLGVGVFLVQRAQVFKLGASPESAPKDVRITNITSASFAVNWTTDRDTIGYIVWGESESSLDNTEYESDTTPKGIHSITIDGLDPGAVNFFKINSDGENYDNNGIPWQQATGPILSQTTTTQMLSGTVLTATGEPAIGVLVFINSGSFSPLSTTTSNSGGWLIPLSPARTPDLSAHATINSSATLIEIFVQAASRGVATAQAYPQTANPTPNITLGQTYNFKNTEISGENGLTSAELTLPEDEDLDATTSGFDTGDDEELDATASGTVTIESIEEDEEITTTTPEFFGEGPVGEIITITVRSDPQTDKVTVDANGNWEWTPPDDLEEGEHTVTLSWRDAAGILHNITKNFIVSAASGPAFESTPSATPKATPSATPKTKATATPSATPRVSLPATGAGTPVAGNLTPTLLLATMGLGLILAGVFVSAKATN
ncbi:MAG: hypothetical protein UV74_C0013G0560 [Candidatus Woesebacteria bacterium GW2011_GWB1_43_14]|uniref:Fibronectin type-III domain-containing protein n=1 Tax=Candidatus Woesebacteria bacterium GW2011_GWB1_43_14 TaxID=1618578 RepID=A0A0G1GEZ4_9BACT|nr:MAG: hypothetical protein UT21_C0001G0273 [Candidatus Woesebacteria bacterium GW2011_GWA1_39_11b]KKS77983.1 MAG: hypothetical protein UV51_C0003G0018 [Candidatus Woesebacteria bacterium GW2011_GWC1_42_9]KKS97438.1 MAG: hypothetical protein UV74_C0013G0560 [Candidatus Woesebacteria bacterium GW2011_GWB1_43_14]